MERVEESVLLQFRSFPIILSLLIAQWCSQDDTIVFGTASTSEGEKAVTEAGASKVFNHRSETEVEDILKATNGTGVDLIIEMLANVNLQKDLEMLSVGGRVCIVGNRGEIKINPRYLFLLGYCTQSKGDYGEEIGSARSPAGAINSSRKSRNYRLDL